MGKYQFSYEEKITIIREHEENHKTLKAICEEYDISKSYLCYILRDYRQNGKELDHEKHTDFSWNLFHLHRHSQGNHCSHRTEAFLPWASCRAWHSGQSAKERTPATPGVGSPKGVCPPSASAASGQSTATPSRRRTSA